jgi:hypothetical protein
MRFPSKVTAYKESSIAKIPIILRELEKNDMTPKELYSKVKKKVSGVQEFTEILDSLYAMRKIEEKEGSIHYVG